MNALINDDTLEPKIKVKTQTDKIDSDVAGSDSEESDENEFHTIDQNKPIIDRMKQFFSKKPSTQDVSAGSEFNEEAELINNLDYQQYMIQNHLKYLMKS